MINMDKNFFNYLIKQKNYENNENNKEINRNKIKTQINNDFHVKHIRKAYLKEPFIKPITSYGIILYYKEKNTISYLLCQRRDSIEYSIVIRGQYYQQQLPLFIRLMTKTEQQRILHFDFEDLWNDLFVNQNSNFFEKLYEQAKEKYMKNYDFILDCIQKYPSDQYENQWGFSKGRLNTNENEIECALREFQEETNIQINFRHLILSKPFIETYSGSNHKIYRTKYFLACADKKYPITINKIQNKHPIRTYTVSPEMEKCSWMPFDEAKYKLPDWRIHLLQKIDHYLHSQKQ